MFVLKETIQGKRNTKTYVMISLERWKIKKKKKSGIFTCQPISALLH